MKKNVIIAVLLALLIWFGATVVRLENYHYATQVGMCIEHSKTQWVERDKCLRSQQTRTNSLWHLAYALGVL